MRVKAKVIAGESTHDGMFARLQFNGKMPKDGETVTVKWGKVRSLDQNALYWQFLTWLIEDAGMKNQGYMDTQELHEALKGRFLAEKITAPGGLKIIKIGSTTELDAMAFMEYIDKVDNLMVTFFNANTAEFWKEYNDFYRKGN